MTLIKFEAAVKGVGLPPPKVMVPALFEKVGSTVQREKAEPSRFTLTTERTVGSNLRVASTALIFAPEGWTRTAAVKFDPYYYMIRYQG